jgi:hypothetical protein
MSNSTSKSINTDNLKPTETLKLTNITVVTGKIIYIHSLNQNC